MGTAVRDLTTALSQEYVVDREIGRGAMATVFLAREVHHNRSVALKVLDPELTHSVAAERFIREIKTTAKLTHPNILPILDSGSAASQLYYVTPYVSGQTLRDCLDKEGALPLADAIAIAQQIADALAYAHEQGVVHRDIKPENILLTSGRQVWVADFGLAHALTSGIDARLTATGMSVGSPLYMSPEQAAGSSRIDARADIYALGCVLYEMLTGATPFTGDDIPSVLAKHLTTPAMHASRLNKRVPPHIDAAICKALEKAPHKRFSNAREFRDAIRPATRVWGVGRKTGIGAALAIAIMALVLLQGPRGGAGRALLPWTRGVTPDTARYVVLPFEAAAGAGVEAQQRMHDALRRWSGIEVVDLIRVQEEVRPDTAVVSGAKAHRIARALGAGRFVRGSVTRLDGRYRVTAAVYDASQRNRAIDQVTLVQANGTLPLDSLYAAVADSLLFGAYGVSGRSPAPRGTSSRPARESYLQGQRALLDWEIARADSMFTAAAKYDPGYAQAQLWLAEVRSWLSDDPAEWQLQAEQAVAGKASLTPREQRLSEALHALATSRFQDACAIYDSLAAVDPQDFFVVYGTADCRRRDRVVVPDRNSESGWRFRSDYYRAILGYSRALKLLPATHKAFRANSFGRVQDLIFTRTSQLTSGRADTLRFLAPATVRGDSIVFIPYLRRQLASVRSARSSPEAIERLRRIYYDIARHWSREYPNSAAATEALALALDLRGDPDAVAHVRRARGQATEPRERAHLGALQVILELKHALPHDRAGVRAAAGLADSLVAANPAHTNWSSFAAAMGVIAGKPDYAAAAARASVSATDAIASLPEDVWADAHALLAYAAIGVRPDSIRMLERRVRNRVDRLATNAEFAYQLTLVRPAFMAFPYVQLPTLQSPLVADDYLIQAQRAFARNDLASARQPVLDAIAKRAGKNPADLQFDAIYPEAWLLHAAGGSVAAANVLDPTLQALSEQDPAGLAELPRIAGLLRAVELRARIAYAQGDRSQARVWSDALLLLWQDADPILTPVVAELRRLR